MRNDHVFYGPVGPNPTPEEIERAMRLARRLRSETVHAYLTRAAEWVAGVFGRPATKPLGPSKTPTLQRC